MTGTLTLQYEADFIAELTALRHSLHRAPEISGEEKATARRMADWLRGCGADEIVEGLGGHGVAGIFDSGAPGPAVLFRCELDALPIHETGTPEWRSNLPGKGHMCGHDGHMAILCGLAKRLQADRPKCGRVVLLFQPAEETGAGARAVVDDARFAGIRPDFAFGLHNLPGMPLGHAAIRDGAFCFASEGLAVDLTGWTSHAAHPEDGRSPARAMTELVTGLPNLPAKLGMRPGEGLVTLSHARLGDPAFGIAPGEARIMATLRSETDALQERLMEAAEDLAGSVAADACLKFAMERSERFAACFNDAAATAMVRTALDATGTPSTENRKPFRWSEDFGVFSGVAPSAFFVLGAGETCPQLHNPDYDFPDAIIPSGLAIFEQLVRMHCS
ncbi:amidohydrolase [Oricola cellulosilytica]|uniref:Amidohydrolase n=1 Tax=Oricola cellulosilytica TaxID=1429082 RepID=A0A4R0PHL8_9HYPH|nr:amidohydrolase [Oricola cellulosilytica]TCD16508.1 amidohydrolase [Oricola cellulosilytica]